MNHLFIIQAHNKPEILARITKRLEAPNHFFYIHIDKKSDIKPFKKCLADVRNIDWCEDIRIKIYWGGVPV